MFGTDFPTVDGTAVRDYVHVCDIAEAHVAALRYLCDGGQSIQLNLGTGEGNSVREVIRMVESVSGLRVRTSDGLRRPGDPAVLIASAERAREVLGWRPVFANLRDTIATAWKWHAYGAQRALATTATV